MYYLIKKKENDREMRFRLKDIYLLIKQLKKNTPLLL